MVDGGPAGVARVFAPKWSKLLNIQTWGEASLLAFMSLFPNWSSFLTLSSQNKFESPAPRHESWLIPFGLAILSILGSLPSAGFVGILAEHLHKNSATLETLGPSLAFVAIPQGISLIPMAPLWSCFYYLALIFTLWGTLAPMLDTLTTGIFDEFKDLIREYRILVLAMQTAILFLIGIAFCTQVQ